ncbi:MAG: trigger factor [Oscillospiraceae bacterium]|nr:trigger factor [Oscillospiraceae bacterium]
MSVKNIERNEKNMVTMTVEVGAAEFEAAVNKAYQKMRGTIKVSGFRPGKAPRKVIEGMYGKGVFYEEAINIAMPEAYVQAVEAEGLQVVGYPEVQLGDVSEEGFSFTAVVAVYPEVKLGQYKGLEAPKDEVKIMAADVNARLAEMAERNTRLVPVERAVKKGDVAVIDFEGFDNGVAFEGGKGENFELEIGSGNFVPGFETQLIGMNAGEEKDLDITFPEDYVADLAGKAVVFHVKVNEVKTKETPEIDDEFAKDVSEFETLKELKADIKKKLTAEHEEAGKRAFEDILMRKVADNIECEVPQAMVDAQIETFMNNFKNQLLSSGMRYEDYLKFTGSDEAKLKEEAAAPALAQVRLDLALEAIIKAENIEVTEEDIEAEYANVASRYGMELETVKKYLAPEQVKEGVMKDKAIAVVVDSAIAVLPEKKAAAKKSTKKAAKEEEKTEEKTEE